MFGVYFLCSVMFSHSILETEFTPVASHTHTRDMTDDEKVVTWLQAPVTCMYFCCYCWIRLVFSSRTFSHNLDLFNWFVSLFNIHYWIELNAFIFIVWYNEIVVKKNCVQK